MDDSDRASGTPGAPEGRAPEEDAAQLPEPVSLDSLSPDDIDSEFSLPDADAFPRTAVEKIRDRDARNRLRRRELETQIETWGGAEAVARAVGIERALQTEEGVMQLFFESGRALGIGVDRMKTLFAGQAEPSAPPAAPGAPGDEEAPVTYKALQGVLEEKVLRPQAEREAEAVFQRNGAAVNKALDDLGVTDPHDRYLVLSLGNQFVGENETDTAALVAATRKGHEEYQKVLAKRSEEYLARKQAAAEAAPTALSGTAPVTGVVPPEPRDVSEASVRARERIRRLAS
jgi:hypothetical protein